MENNNFNVEQPSDDIFTDILFDGEAEDFMGLTKTTEEERIKDEKRMAKIKQEGIDQAALKVFKEEQARIELENAKSVKQTRAKSKKKSSNITSIYEQAKTYNERYETVVFEDMKKNLVINQLDGDVYYYNSHEGVYINYGEEDMKAFVSASMNSLDIAGYDNDAGHISCLKSFKAFLIKEGKRIKFDDTKFCADIIDRQGNRVPVHFSIDLNDAGQYVYVFEKAKASNNVNFKVYAPLDILKAVSRSDYKAPMDIQKDVKYFYNPSYNNEAPVFKLLLNKMYAADGFGNLERVWWGTALLGINTQTSLFKIGNGRDGKGVFDRILTEIFNSDSHKQKKTLNLNDEYTFANDDIQSKRILSTSELKKDKFNEQLFKRITGGDAANMYKKNKGSAELNVKTTFTMVNANYDDLFMMNDTGESMNSRMAFVKVLTSKVRIANFEDTLMNGGIIDHPDLNDGKRFKIEGTAKSDLVEWMMVGGLEFKGMRTLDINNFGKDVVEFKNEIIAKMTASTEFFDMFPMTMVPDGYGVNSDDAYYLFLKYSNKRPERYSKAKFVKEVKNHYDKAFKNGQFTQEYNAKDMRVFVENEDGTKSSNRMLACNFSGANLLLRRASEKYKPTLEDVKVHNFKSIDEAMASL